MNTNTQVELFTQGLSRFSDRDPGRIDLAKHILKVSYILGVDSTHVYTVSINTHEDAVNLMATEGLVIVKTWVINRDEQEA